MSDIFGTSSHKMCELDDKDRAILRILQRDASISMDALSEQVNLSRNATWRRIKGMEQAGIIRGRTVTLDPVAVGCGLQVVVLVKTQAHAPDWLARFQTAVRAMPEVVSAHRMTGDLDYMLRVRVADVAGYDRFYKRLIAKVEIADVSASFVMEDLKDGTAIPV